MLMACLIRKIATNARETLFSVMSLAVEMRLISVNPAGFCYEYPSASICDVPMMRKTREIMEGWELPDGPVVRGLDGGRMNPSTARGRLQKVFSETAEFDGGTPVPRMTQFSMRHSFGTTCITAGIEVSKLSRWMGHVDVTTTINRYVGHRIADPYEDADIIDAALG